MLFAKRNSNIRKLGMYALVAALAFSAAYVSLAHATNPVTFYACQSIGLKSLYNVAISPSAPLACKKGDIAVEWNQVGQMGPQGENGLQGPAGAKGADGSDGPQGPQGEMGPAGSQGSNGADGNVGSQGPQGEMGAAGPQGPAGAGINRDHTYSVQVEVTIDPDQTGGAAASCNDSNDILLSGGYDSGGPWLDTYRSLPYPYFLNQTWTAYAINNGSIPATLTVKVSCLQVD